MNMIEALELAWNTPETLAVRPLSWKNSGVAILMVNSMFVLASEKGLALSPIPGQESFKEWESLTTEELEAEVTLIQNKAKDAAVDTSTETPSASA